jgi:hypothetical protein
MVIDKLESGVLDGLLQRINLFVPHHRNSTPNLVHLNKVLMEACGKSVASPASVAPTTLPFQKRSFDGFWRAQRVVGTVSQSSAISRLPARVGHIDRQRI